MSNEEKFGTLISPEKSIRGWDEHIQRVEALEKEVLTLKKEVKTLKKDYVSREELKHIFDITSKAYLNGIEAHIVSIKK